MHKDTQDIFNCGKTQDEIRIDAAKKILIKAGYRILDPIVVNPEIKTIAQLKNYFYMRFYSKYPAKQRDIMPNPALDMKIVSGFVEAQIGGAGKDRAIQECVALIDTLFDYEDKFNFKYPIKDIGILGQGKMAWITAKAIDILNKARKASVEKEMDKRASQLENDIRVDSDEIENKLDAMIRQMEANNG